MREIDEFKRIYKNEMEKKKGVHKIEFFGSTEESRRWKSGKSDLDIKVYGENVPSEVKIEGILLVESLNYRLGLKLENVPLQHWTPFYIESLFWRILDQLSEEELVREFTESIRKEAKEIIKRYGWPLKYKDLWNIVRVMSVIEQLPLVPKLSKVLL